MMTLRAGSVVEQIWNKSPTMMMNRKVPGIGWAALMGSRQSALGGKVRPYFFSAPLGSATGFVQTLEEVHTAQPFGPGTGGSSSREGHMANPDVRKKLYARASVKWR